MREIIFRGKRIDNGEWVKGMPCATEQSGIYAIQTLQGGIFDIIPETVGQYTGLTDKNGKKIFEGDIAKATTTDGRITTICKIGIGLCEETDSDVKCMGVYCYFNNAPYVLPCNEKYKDLLGIIGNIHDNPELLKGGEQE